jgi:hypothetical protein
MFHQMQMEQQQNEQKSSSIEYTFVQNDNAETQPIKIINGEYTGLIFSVDRVQFFEKNDRHHLEFDYNMIEGDDPKDEEFHQTVGDIISDILDKELMNNPEGVFVSDEDYRKSNTNKSPKE